MESKGLPGFESRGSIEVLITSVTGPVGSELTRTFWCTKRDHSHSLGRPWHFKASGKTTTTYQGFLTSITHDWLVQYISWTKYWHLLGPLRRKSSFSNHQVSRIIFLSYCQYLLVTCCITHLGLKDLRWSFVWEDDVKGYCWLFLYGLVELDFSWRHSDRCCVPCFHFLKHTAVFCWNIVTRLKRAMESPSTCQNLALHKLLSCWAQLRTWCCRRGSVQPAVIAGCVATSCHITALNFQLKLHFAYLALHDASVTIIRHASSPDIGHCICDMWKMHAYLAIRPTKPHIRIIRNTQSFTS